MANDYSWDHRKNHRSGRHKRTGKEQAVISLGISDSGKGAATFRNMVNGTLQQLGIEIDEAMQAIIDEVCEEGAAQLRERSTQLFGDKSEYAKGWVYSNTLKFRDKKVAVIHNKNQPQLGHLLEFGHPIFNQYGATEGYSAPIEHIEPVRDWCEKELSQRLERELK